MVLWSLEEAHAVFQKHLAEQKEAGGKGLDAWLTVSRDILLVGVRDYHGELPMTIAYEYRLGFKCAGIHQIRRRPRPKRLKYPPLRQLHMFADAQPR